MVIIYFCTVKINHHFFLAVQKNENVIKRVERGKKLYNFGFLDGPERPSI